MQQKGFIDIELLPLMVGGIAAVILLGYLAWIVIDSAKSNMAWVEKKITCEHAGFAEHKKLGRISELWLCDGKYHYSH